jgi:general secretion pathway protein N
MASAERQTEATNWLPWLLGIGVVLAGLLAWDWQSQEAPTEARPSPPATAARGGTGVRAPSAGPDAPPGAAHMKPLAGLDLDRLHDTVKRPLFERSRRPVEPPPAPPSKPAPAAPVASAPTADENALTLLGVVLGSDGRTVALLKRNKGGQSVRAEEGDVVEGWTVRQIEPQRVILSHGQRQIALQLFRKPAR